MVDGRGESLTKDNEDRGEEPAIGRSYDAAKGVCDPDFFKASLDLSLGVSWSNFTSLFSEPELTEPLLGSLGLCREVSRLFLKRH